MYYITLIIDITIIRVITITITLELLDSLTSYLLFVFSENYIIQYYNNAMRMYFIG